MYIPASSEFVALCQSQVAVLTQGLGAALSAVYLTGEILEGEQAKLIPIVVYPETTTVGEENNTDFLLPGQMSKTETMSRFSQTLPRLLPQATNHEQQVGSTSPKRQANSLSRQRQIILPLIHEGVVMGFLVTGREDRSWNKEEQATIERIAQTLAIAYIIDQRRTWSEQRLTQMRSLQAKQRDLLHNLLHQFRNPLTAIRTFGKLLLKRLLPEDKNYKVASSIVQESDRLQELLQQFNACIDMSQVPLALPPATVNETPSLPESNSLLPGMDLTLESFALETVLEPLLVAARAIAQERLLDLYTYIATDLPLVQGNIKALREVLNNLIDNALKYTPEGGKIEILVSIKSKQDIYQENYPSLNSSPLSLSIDEAVAITISDTGPGINSKDKEHLFERHYRGVQALTTIPGTGLGLAIAKELVEQMQGKIEVFSPAQQFWTKRINDSVTKNKQTVQGQGTTFVVWLPTV
ncbi:MAG: GAF domain-containing sensor histidine kinase [Symploca sp. SIO1C2]|nr:GAF domain-containing sensor histidine kinase [Symploca sp. SIO1C2]NER46488.1 GAF domain-containing sensor histidine kinase [Symploca sp. SIO1A3]